MSSNTITVCEPSTVLDDVWRRIYEKAFPESEREPESKLAQLIDAGRLLYHRTLDKDGDLLCFSMLSLASDFSLLAFLATNQDKRSSGIGSKHMRKLVELMKEKYSTHLGMFLEIEATGLRNTKVSDEEQKIRERRLAFYTRLDVKYVCRSLRYLAPARGAAGQELDLDLMYFNYRDKPMSTETKSRIVSEIYQQFYCLEKDNPLLKKVLAEFDTCTNSGCSKTASERVCLEDGPSHVAADTAAKSAEAPAAPVEPASEVANTKATVNTEQPGPPPAVAEAAPAVAISAVETKEVASPTATTVMEESTAAKTADTIEPVKETGHKCCKHSAVQTDQTPAASEAKAEEPELEPKVDTAKAELPKVASDCDVIGKKDPASPEQSVVQGQSLKCPKT